MGRTQHGMDSYHHELAMIAHEARLRAERIDELTQILNDHEGSLKADEQIRFTAAVTLLLEEAPKLKAATEMVGGRAL